MKKTITIATRKSKLALWQAQSVQQQLANQHPWLQFELLPIMSSGDKNAHQPLADIGGKALFIKELETALLNHQADIAVHSVKDMPPQLPDGLTLACTLEREDPRDCFIHPQYHRLDDMPQHSIIGTSSPRRAALIAHLYPNLRTQPIRGNVDTRLEKLHTDAFDGIILACAGLKRLNINHHPYQTLPIDAFIPAAGQGAIGIECRSDDDDIKTLIAPLNHPNTQQCVAAEQHTIATLSGNCHSAIGAHATILDDQITLNAIVLGKHKTLTHTLTQPSNNSNQIGQQLAQTLIQQGAKTLLE
jgi:hydroxymethylbilane synthase